MVIDVSCWGALSWVFFWLIHTILTGPPDSINMVKGKNSIVITSFVISFFPSKALDKKGLNQKRKTGHKHNNTHPRQTGREIETRAWRTQTPHIRFQSYYNIVLKKPTSFNRQEVFDLSEDGTYGGRAKTKVQQFINFNMTAAARVWTEWDHQLSKNIEACLHEMRQDFLITVWGLTKGKWLKRRPSTVNTVWRGLCGESSFQCYERNAKGCGRKKTQGLDRLYRPGAKLFFLCLHEFWPMCEVQETFL